jgi:hypothetical protein
MVLIFLFSACSYSTDKQEVEPEVEKEQVDENPVLEIDTNDIESQIALHEYLIREHYGQWGMDEEKLQKLKDSINYDSILRNRKYPVYK